MSKAKAYHLIEDFPNKLYYTIAEVADDVGVEQSALRFWENEFDVLKPKRDPRGKRQYTKKDVLTVRQIYDLVKIEGLSLEGAKAKIKNKKGEVERNSELRAKLLSLKEQIKALSSLLTLPSEVEAEEEESEKIQLVGYPTVTIEEYKPVMFDPTPEKEEETATAEPVDETPAEPATVEPSEPEAEVEAEEIKAEPAAEVIVEEAKEEAPAEAFVAETGTETETETEESAEEEPQQVHVFQQNSLFGEEFVEKITYTPKKDQPEEEPKENKKEDIDSRQLSLF